MGGVAAVDGEAGFFYDVGEQVLDVPAFFFPPFKTQHHFAGKGIFVGRQDPAGGEQHGHVAVVAAGVGDSGHMGQADFLFFQVLRAFGNGQGIGVRPHEQSLSGFSAVDDPQKTPVGHVDGGDLQLFQIGFQKGDGVHFPAAQLRVFMEMAAEPDGFRKFGPGQGKDVHKQVPFCANGICPQYTTNDCHFFVFIV